MNEQRTDNLDIAKIFEQVADLLEIQGANQFRIRAYRTAARTIQTQTIACAALAASDPKALERLPGIGKDLATKIREIAATGTLTLLRELSAELPEGLIDLVRLPGLGPKRAKLIYDTLKISTLEDLELAAKAGRLRQVRGLGATTESRILQSLAERKATGVRFRVADADTYVQPLLKHLTSSGASVIDAIDVAGSYRRRCETVGDADVLVAATEEHAPAIAERFVQYPFVKQVLAKGETKCSILLRSGIQIDLRIVRPESYGAALHYFTGSKAHNIAIRTLGVKSGLKINEYGVFRDATNLGGRDEESVFRAVGLPWIPPELREDRGEIDAAREGRLPKLVELSDIRGDLQMHTTYTDGRNSVLEMAEACRARGYAYFAITDHTQALAMAGGLNRDGFKRQFREIDEAQHQVPGIRILKGAEVDILPDGQLDLDDDTLRELDVVVISVHSRFNMGRDEMTRRVVRALQHPRAHILGHPTGRLLGRREPYPIDMDEIVKTAHAHRVLLEVNAQPHRLDLNDIYVKLARDAGVRLVVSTDAHRIEELSSMRYGVDQARRGWCEAADVGNTRSLDEFQRLIAK